MAQVNLLLLTDNFIPLLVTPMTSVEASLLGTTDLGVKRLPDLAAIARRRKERVAAIVQLTELRLNYVNTVQRDWAFMGSFVVVTVDGVGS